MQKLKITVFTMMMMLPILPTTASAESWICESGELIREISVKRETANAAPCSVVYDKEIEGKSTKTLWSAQNDGAYCDSKADGLAARLTNSGWNCSAIQ